MNEKDVIKYLRELPAADINEMLKKALTLEQFTKLIYEMSKAMNELFSLVNPENEN